MKTQKSVVGCRSNQCKCPCSNLYVDLSQLYSEASDCPDGRDENPLMCGNLGKSNKFCPGIFGAGHSATCHVKYGIKPGMILCLGEVPCGRVAKVTRNPCYISNNGPDYQVISCQENGTWDDGEVLKCTTVSCRFSWAEKVMVNLADGCREFSEGPPSKRGRLDDGGGTEVLGAATGTASKSDGEDEPQWKDVEAKEIKKGTAKNKCVCGPEADEPTRSQLVEDHEAHVLVAEWRLHKFQSPIELNHDETISHDHFDPLEFHGHWDEDGEATFENTGKTAQIRLKRDEQPYLVGGPLHEDVYLFEQLHFHWGDDDNLGCEHIFEGKAYSMEAHAVHFNKKYESFQEAADKPDGLAVVGFFLEATDNDDNPCFKKLTTAVQEIIKVNTSTSVAPDCLTWIKEEAQCKGYYTYQGSLTTEPYLESVTWILYPTPIHVSRHQVAHFRELKSTPCEKVNITNNVRPIQTPPPNKKPSIFFARSHRKSDD